MEAGDLMRFFGEDDSRWSAVLELAEIVAGKAPGRTSPEQITLFRSNGIAIEDIVVAGHIYELARERGLGKQIAMWGEEVRASGARGV
jgi:ornithine cyclodeaminase/alanine dehydrogenase-like protein (mu-crystallin family)